MARVLASYAVHSPAGGTSVPLDIVEGLDLAHIDYIDQTWKPVMTKQYHRALLEYFTLPIASQTDAIFTDILTRLGIPDQHWDWRLKSTIAPGSQRLLYGIVDGNTVEAAMMLLFGRESRITPGLPVVYVDYLATAPWNRPTVQQPERFKRLGALLLGTAVEISRIKRWDGRCALHALPSANGFYQKSGMQDLGPDPTYHDMHYFEFDAATAQAFLT